MTQRLLLVDDEEPILFAMSAYFTSWAYGIDCASELEEAQALVAHVSYACVISDLRLSGTQGAEGLELVSFVRRMCVDTRVLVLTAYGSDSLERTARARGADAVLQKPIRLRELDAIVKSLLGERSSC